MVALGEADSKSLFHNSVYPREEDQWPDHFKETSKKMLEVCGGVPLAIIIAAGLFGTTSAELSVQSKWLNTELVQFYSTSQVMRTILEISYADLPLPLKSCFLYLSAFTGNCHINKDRLIQRWVAEGLIHESRDESEHRKSLWETGGSYFDELIRRRLIQPVFDDSYDDEQPIGCTIHGVIFYFVESLSTKENFVTAGAELKPGSFPCDRVRQISSLDCSNDEDSSSEQDEVIPLHLEDESGNIEEKCCVDSSSDESSSSDEDSSSDKDEAISLHLSRVRSLAFTGDATRIPDLSVFKHVRVLDLEDTKGLENKQLENIGRLSLLRFLGLGSTDVTVLPEQIIELEHLCTLDLRRSNVRKLPSFRDTKLVSLLVHDLTIWRGMGARMQKLEELSDVLVGVTRMVHLLAMWQVLLMS